MKRISQILKEVVILSQRWTGPQSQSNGLKLEDLEHLERNHRLQLLMLEMGRAKHLLIHKIKKYSVVKRFSTHQRRTRDQRRLPSSHIGVKLKSGSKKSSTKEPNKLARSLKPPRSSKPPSEQSEPSTPSQPKRKNSRKKTTKRSLLSRKKSKKLQPNPTQPDLEVAARKEAERRAKDRPQSPSRWASSDPG